MSNGDNRQGATGGSSRREPPILEGEAHEVKSEPIDGVEPDAPAAATPEGVEAIAADDVAAAVAAGEPAGEPASGDAPAESPPAPAKKGPGKTVVVLVALAAVAVAGGAAWLAAPDARNPGASALKTTGQPSSEAPAPAAPASTASDQQPATAPEAKADGKTDLKPDGKTEQAPKPADAAPAQGAAGSEPAARTDAAAESPKPQIASPADQSKPAEEAKPAEPPKAADAAPAVQNAAPAQSGAPAPQPARAAQDAPGAPPAADPRVDALAQRIEALAQRSDTLQTRLGAVAGNAAPAAEVGARIDALAARLAALEAKLDAPKSDARAPQSRENAPPAVEPVAARAVVIQALAQSLRAGAPLGADVAALRNLDTPADKLGDFAPYLTAGAPGAAQLAAQWAGLRAGIAATDTPAPSGDWLDRLAAKARTLVKIKQSGVQSGPSATAVASRVEAALQRGDLDAALAASDALPDAAKPLAADWRKTVAQRVKAEAAARALLTESIATLGRPKS